MLQIIEPKMVLKIWSITHPPSPYTGLAIEGPMLAKIDHLRTENLIEHEDFHNNVGFTRTLLFN